MYYRVCVSYDGSKFYGFQRLPGFATVQDRLEQALTKINKKGVVVKGAGRTDRGVHALGQVVSFKLDISIDLEGLCEAVNSLVAPYIFVYDAKVVDSSFHARFSVKSKQYVYKINLGNYNPLQVDYVYQCPYNLDIDKMKEVSSLFLGVHDFHNFVSGERDDFTCIIHSINFEINDNILCIYFNGKSFYRYMVRNLVGAMIEVGRGKWSYLHVKNLLETKENRASYTAPACGLYLVSINY